MRIGLNLLYLLPGVVGGTETHAAGLIHALCESGDENDFFVFLNRDSEDWALPELPNLARVVCPIAARPQIFRYAFEQGLIPLLLRRYRIDVVHSLGYVAPLLSPCPSIVSIHDLNYRAFGDAMPASRRLALRFFVRQSALRSARVVTGSLFARSEIRDAFDLPEDRIEIIHSAPKDRRVSSGQPSAEPALPPGVPSQRPYILAFSSSSPNKNIPRLMQAFQFAREEYGLPHALVLAGHPPEAAEMEHVRSQVKDGDVRFTGYLSDELLDVVLRNAQILAFPSVYEGVGLPVLEAMERGVPVVCSDRASLPEMAGDAAIFFDPFSIHDMAAKLARLALDAELRADLISKGFENVRRFSWSISAQRALALYRAVVEENTFQRSSRERST